MHFPPKSFLVFYPLCQQPYAQVLLHCLSENQLLETLYAESNPSLIPSQLQFILIKFDSLPLYLSREFACALCELIHTVYHSFGQLTERQMVACGLRVSRVLQSGEDADVSARLVYQVVDALFDRWEPCTSRSAHDAELRTVQCTSKRSQPRSRKRANEALHTAMMAACWRLVFEHDGWAQKASIDVCIYRENKSSLST